MATNLVILESPGKIVTVKNYLGSNYKVIASVGHIRDLPKSSLGIDIDNGFEAHYINIRGKGDVIKELKKEAKKADKIFFATDPDREGEAISWHLASILGEDSKKAKRISFNEITRAAVKEAIKNPREIDLNLVNSQQARRFLDRIVGYKVSPVLWKTVKSGLSAGRVQSVATKIIVEKEQEIQAFKPVEYWTIDATLTDGKRKNISARFYGSKSKRIKLKNQKDSFTILEAVKGGEFRVCDIKKGSKKRLPSPPFITSTLQHPAAQSCAGAQVRIRHGCLAPLDEPPAHKANDSPILPDLSPHAGEQVGMPVVKGIEFADNTRRAHRAPPFASLIYTQVYHIPPLLSRRDGDFHKECGGKGREFEKTIHNKIFKNY